MPQCILMEQNDKIKNKLKLLSIQVETPPNKMEYYHEDTFDPTGMVVTATYGTDNIILSTIEITNYTTSKIEYGNPLTITYTEQGYTCTTTLDITVNKYVANITVLDSSIKTPQVYGEAFDFTNLVVRGMRYPYSGEASFDISKEDYDYSPKVPTRTGTQTITVTYKGYKPVSYSFTVEVSKKSIPKPTQKAGTSLGYTGSTYNIVNYLNNYNSNYMTSSGTSSATNAGTYTVSFAPKSGYIWEDGTNDSVDIIWTINKATGTLTANQTVVALDNNNLNAGVILVSDMGKPTFSPTKIDGLTLSLNLYQGRYILSITGDGSTALNNEIITIYPANNNNYTTPNAITITVSAEYWSWGDETSIGDEAWWAGLKNWGANVTASERAACVGKKKLVSLSTAVLGANAATMLCIGVDQDGTGTLTFQTEGVLPATTTFGSSNPRWILSDSTSSIARTQCENFYNYCSAQTSIKTVSKGTCLSQEPYGKGSATYSDETVWIPSETEMGLNNTSSLNMSNSTTSNSECTQGYNETYKYYSINTSRIKYKMNNDGSIMKTACQYWERSRSSSNSYNVCCINSKGSSATTSYSNKYYLAPAFVIG